MRRLSNSLAQGSISGFVALSLLVMLSWVGGRNCATTLVLSIKIFDLQLFYWRSFMPLLHVIMGYNDR
jgi:hypothetical protein